MRPIGPLNPKITDFGLAKRLEVQVGPTQSGAILGTPSYMAPEQAQGKNEALGPAADIYALGVILYECLTGRPPFLAATPVDTILQMLRDEPVPPRCLQPTVPRDLETICLHCLAKEPAKRYRSAAELAEDLRRFRAGEPIRARPVGLWGRSVKWVRRRPALAALLGVSSVAVLAVVLLGAWYNLRLTAEVHEARRQRGRADGNLREALKVVDGMLNALQDPRTGRVVELDEPRRRQLDQAVQFYQGVLAEPDNATAEARRLSGQAYYNLGRIFYMLGNELKAKHHYQEAAAVQQTLVDDFPGERDYRKDLVATLSAPGGGLGELDDYEAGYRKALALLAELAREDPDDLECLKRQAIIHNYQYGRFVERKQLDQAEAALQKALLLGETLVQRRPKDLDYRITLAHTCTRLGLMAIQAGQKEQARSYLQKSLAVLEPHASEQATDRDFIVALAQTYNIQALAAMYFGRPEERRDWCTRMIDLLEAALRPQSRDAHLRRLLAEAHGGRGVALTHLGKYTQALPDLDRLVELSDEPERRRYRVHRAMTRAFARDHAGACAEAQELAGLTGADGPFLYELVRIYCMALPWAQQDEQLADAGRKQVVEEYGRQAVALLAKARAAGFFRDPEKLKLLHEDDALKQLRDRDDFKQVLKAGSDAP